jgi:ribonuclease D
MLITSAGELSELAERLARCEVIAVDSEGNGMHAYRPRLCTLQLGFREDGAELVMIVDTIGLALAPLAPILGAAGPLKVLHDLSFDARMLAASGIELGHVRDTSVTARFLGIQATGLASLLEARLGVKIDKGLQGHDWARRPLGERELAYLASDVQHLLALDDSLRRDAGELGIGSEIEVECAYKLKCALAPPRHGGPAPSRVKGYADLDRAARGVFRELWAERERLAELEDRPSHRIAPAGLLLALARARPGTLAELRRIAGTKLSGESHAWLAAVKRAQPSDEPYQEAPRVDRLAPLKRRLDGALSRWRRGEAASRGIDPQVVTPGHCMGALVDVLAERGDDAQLLERLRGIEGMCAGRVDRYGSMWLTLARRASREHSGEEQG